LLNCKTQKRKQGKKGGKKIVHDVGRLLKWFGWDGEEAKQPKT
jgi:hypothetical protein